MEIAKARTNLVGINESLPGRNETFPACTMFALGSLDPHALILEVAGTILDRMLRTMP